MSLAGTIADKALDYAIENPQTVVSFGRTAVGALSEASSEESPLRPYLVGAGLGFMVGFMVAAWMCSPAKITRNKNDELLRSIRNQAPVRRHRPAALRTRQRAGGPAGEADPDGDGLP